MFRYCLVTFITIVMLLIYEINDKSNNKNLDGVILMNDIKFTHDIMQEHDVERYFKIWRESVIRSRLTITAVFLKQLILHN